MARPMTIKFFRSDIVRKKIEALPDALQKPIRIAVARGGDEVVALARRLVPKDDRILEASIRWEWVKADDGRFRCMIVIGPSGEFLKAHGRIPSLARWIEFGTAPAEKGKKGVRFTMGGKLRQTDRVSGRTHPGLPARPYLFAAWRQLKKKLKQNVKEAVNAALKAHGKKG